MIKRKCAVCGKTFQTHSYLVKKGFGKYCSIDCSALRLKGIPISIERRNKMLGMHNSPETEFKKGHPSPNKNKQLLHLRGRNASKWKGGKTRCNGYVLVMCPTHPFVNRDGYIKRSRLTMEKSIGRYLYFGEVVHHINGIKDDDRITNLQLLTDSAHRSLHASIK